MARHLLISKEVECKPDPAWTGYYAPVSCPWGLTGTWIEGRPLEESRVIQQLDEAAQKGFADLQARSFDSEEPESKCYLD